MCKNFHKDSNQSSENTIMIWGNEMATFMCPEERKGLVIYVNGDKITLAFLNEENKITLIEVEREQVLQSHHGEFIPPILEDFNEKIDYLTHVANSDEENKAIVEAGWKKAFRIIEERERNAA